VLSLIMRPCTLRVPVAIDAVQAVRLEGKNARSIARRPRAVSELARIKQRQPLQIPLRWR